MKMRLTIFGVLAVVSAAVLATSMFAAAPTYAWFRNRARVPVHSAASVQASAVAQTSPAAQGAAVAQALAPVQASAPTSASSSDERHPPIPADVRIDPQLPPYTPGQGFTLKMVGSDTMKPEMTALVEGFEKFFPFVAADIESKGSSFGPPALLAGTAHFAPMSRGMTAKEIDEFKKKFGYPPVALPVSIDMIAVWVHKDNPIQGMTLQQVDAAFSLERKGGFPKAVNTWGDLGLKGDWADKPITIYGRNSASGTNRFFREHALFNGTYRPEVKEQLDSTSIVEGVAHDKYAMGYSGMGYRTAEVRALPLALDFKSPYIAAEPSNAYSGDYPMTRVLLLYVNHQPGTELGPLRREFIRYLYSQQGQSDVLRSGFLPVSSQTATRALASVDLKP